MDNKDKDLLNNKKTEHYKYFTNKECEYFPCHKCDDVDDFNCLFCFCPLYCLGDKCGGNFVYLSNGVKDCSNCLVPHKKENYDYIVKKLNEYIYGDK